MKSIHVCSVQDVVLNSGRAALIDGKQVAVFRISTAAGEQFFALDNFCPFAKANVLSRGIVGSLKGNIVVASPIYKQHFYLKTGVCVENPTVSVKTWLVSVEGDKLFIICKERAAA